MRPMRTIFAVVFAIAATLSAQTKKIVVDGMSPQQIAALQTASPQVKLVAAGGDLMAQLADADAYFGARMSPQIVKAAPKLQWMQTYSAGVETQLMTPEFRNSKIVLTNCKIIQGPNIADHAFALLLPLTRGTLIAARDREKEEWNPRLYKTIELRGKTAVVVGVGGIGQQIAQRAAAFGMKVIGVDPKEIPYSPYIERVVTPDHLNEVLPEADVLFISAPHTPESEGMIGAKQFELMKKDSYFIAVSRGKVYDTPSLVKALDSQRLAGAGLDVTNPEPLPAGHALWKFSNVLITPHVAGQSDMVWARRLELIQDNIRRFVAGQTLVNVVDKQKGY